jgi:hypothetical protein
VLLSIVFVECISRLPVVPSTSRIPVSEPFRHKSRRSPFPKSFPYVATTIQSYLPFLKSFHCHTSKISPVSRAIATDPKTPPCKSFSCHTSEIPRGLHSNTVGRAVSRALSSLTATLTGHKTGGGVTRYAMQITGTRVTEHGSRVVANFLRFLKSGGDGSRHRRDQATVGGDVAAGLRGLLNAKPGLPWQSLRFRSLTIRPKSLYN